MDWFDCTGQDQEFLVANNPAFAEAIGTRRTSISNVIWESGVPIIAIFTPALHEMTGEVVGVVTLQSEVESFFRSNVHKKTHEPLAFVAIESGCGDLLTFQLENSMPTLIRVGGNREAAFGRSISALNLRDLYSSFLSSIPSTASRARYQQLLFPPEDSSPNNIENFPGCSFSIVVHPTLEFKEHKSSRKMTPIAYPIMAPLFFLVTVLLFLFYDSS